MKLQLKESRMYANEWTISDSNSKYMGSFRISTDLSDKVRKNVIEYLYKCFSQTTGWQGLQQEEIEELFANNPDVTRTDYVRITEQILKEKNS